MPHGRLRDDAARISEAATKSSVNYLEPQETAMTALSICDAAVEP